MDNYNLRRKRVAKISSLILGAITLSINYPVYSQLESALCSSSTRPPSQTSNEFIPPEPKMHCSFVVCLDKNPIIYDESLPYHSPAIWKKWDINELYSLMNQAFYYLNYNEYNKAIESYQKLLNEYNEALPKNHLYVGIIQFNLGIVYYQQGNYIIAREQYKNSYPAFTKPPGSSHPYRKIIGMASELAKKPNSQESREALDCIQDFKGLYFHRN